MILGPLRRAVRNSWALATGANLLIGILGMATSSLIARMLGPVDRGVLAGALLWSGILFAGFGLPGTQSVVYYWSRARSDETRRAVAGTALALATVSAAVCIPVAIVANRWVLQRYGRPEVIGAANVYLLALSFSLLAGAIGAAFLASGRATAFWGLRVGNAVVYFVAVALISAVGMGSVFWYALAAASGVAASTVLGIYLFRRTFSIAPKWVPDVAREMAAFSIKANGAGLPYQINLRLDQALMTVLVPAGVLGQYAVAFTWSSIVMLLGGGLSVVLLAHSAAAGPSAEADQIGALFSQFRMVAIAVCLVGGAAAAAAPIALPMLFGIAFAPAVLPAVLLCFGSVILTLTLGLHEIARGLGHPGVGIPAETTAMGVGLLLLLVLLRPLGAIGAAIASVAGYGTALVILVLLLDRRLDRSVIPALVPRVQDVQALARRARTILRSRLADAGQGAE